MAVKIRKSRLIPQEAPLVAARLRALARELQECVNELQGTPLNRGNVPETVRRAVAPRKLLLVPEVARRLGMNVQRVYELVRQNRLPHIRLGRQIRFSAVALDEWIANGGK